MRIEKTTEWLQVFFSPFPPSYVTRNKSFFKNVILYYILPYNTQNIWELLNPKSSLHLQMCNSKVVTDPMGPFSIELSHDALAPMANKRDALNKNILKTCKKNPHIKQVNN
jgi:hypothetical protein